MEFEKLKEDIREILNKYLDNIDVVNLEENDIVDDEGNQGTYDGYFAIATLLQRGFNESLQRVYEDIPQDYWGDEDECGCGCGCHHEDGEDCDCGCGCHHEDGHDCCCGDEHDDCDCEHHEHHCCCNDK